MALIPVPTGNTSPGIEFQNIDMKVTLTAITCAAGDVLAIDPTVVDTGLRMFKARQPVTADFASASGAFIQTWFGVALASQATSGGDVMVRLSGRVNALTVSNTATVGLYLSPTNAARGLTVAAAAVGSGTRMVALGLTATGAGNTIAPVLFDGMGSGFGYDVTNTT